MASCSNDGAGGKCVPCESLDSSYLLDAKDVRAQLSSSMPLWCVRHLDEESSSAGASISRKFTAKNFQCALDAINAMGSIAEREGHHPDFHLTSYRDVEIVIYTHSLGGVSQNDIALAKMFDDEVTVVYSPKWLREHLEAKKET